MAATEYRVPPISNVSLDDLMRLRLQEDIYEDVRGCLVNLVNGVANYNSVNYRSYEVEVREAAEDLVRPTYERLNSRRRQDKLASIVAGYAVGSVISMAFNAVASMLTGPLALGGHHAARVAGGTGRRAVARRVDSKGRELSVATSVLLSVMDQPK